MLSLHGTLAEIAALETALAETDSPSDQLHMSASIAWYLRERETERAETMGSRVLDALVHRNSDLATVEDGRLAGRAAATTAAAAVMAGNIALGRHRLTEAQRRFEDTGDQRGIADCLLLWAEIAIEDGRTEDREQILQAAREGYSAIGFEPGIIEADAWIGHCFIVKGDHARASALLNCTLKRAKRLDDHHGMALAHYGLGRIGLDKNEFALAIRELMTGLSLVEAEKFDFLERFFSDALSIAYSNSSNYADAIEWAQRGYAVCRRQGWRIGMASELNCLGEAHLQRGDLESARRFLEEAFEILRAYPANRSLGLNREYAGEVYLRLGLADEAAACFEQYRQLADTLRHPNLQCEAHRGLALARSMRGEARLALEAGRKSVALALSKADHYRLCRAYAALADIYRRHPDLPAEPGLSPSQPEIAYLLRAVEAAASIDDYVVPYAIYEALSVAYERIGDLVSALTYRRHAETSWRHLHNRESEERFRSLAIQFETDRARAEAEHHRALAAEEQKRVQALEEATNTLALLGDIGQQITANLNIEAVFRAVHVHIVRMMDAPVFGIGLLKDDGQAVELTYMMQNGVRLEPLTVSVDHPYYLAAKAVRERREILLTGESELAAVPVVPGSPSDAPPVRTALYRPLEVSHTILGVMTVQSHGLAAFGSRELQIIRTLASYGAIALANAFAYAELDRTLAVLRDAQDQLVEQQRLASLGQLVAGVAHEINTPLGVAMTAASQMADDLANLAKRYHDRAMRREDLEQYLQRTQEGHGLLESNLRRGASLVESFKQVAVDQTSEQLRTVRLTEFLHDVTVSLSPELRKRRVGIEVICDPVLFLTTYPGALAQILTNLIMNSLIHAFEGIDSPHITIESVVRDDRELILRYRDNGVGMPAETCRRAFEPFFTTKRTSGGTGLGLHIVHNTVTGLLKGRVQLDSRVGQGSAFTLQIPLVRQGPAQSR